jgi:hypothetical protein
MAQPDITGIAVVDGQVHWMTFRRGKRDLEAPTTGMIGAPEPAAAAPATEAEAATAGEAPTPESIAAALTGMQTELVLGLPFEKTLLRIIRLPTDEPAELRSMVDLQVDKLSPFAPEQTVAAFESLPGATAGTTTVLIAIAQRAVLDEMQATLGKAALARVDALLLGLWDGLARTGQLAEHGREFLLVADESGVQVIVHESGIPLACTYVAGPFDLSRPDDRSDIGREVARLLMALETDHGQPTSLSGAVWAAPAAATALAATVGEICGTACRDLDRQSLPAALEGIVRRGGRGAQAIDLTPAAWRQTEQAIRFRRRLWRAAGAVILAWGLLVSAAFALLAYERRLVGRLNAESQAWLTQANDVRTMRRRVNMIQRYRDRHDSALECLREVSVMLPQGIDLETFTYRKDESVEVAGLASNSQIILAFRDRLNGSPLFKRIVAGPSTRMRDGRFRFSLELSFKSGGPPS